MRKSQQEQSRAERPAALPISSARTDSYVCSHEEDGGCITCSDQAISVKVLRINHEAGLALVTAGEETEEIDITLVEEVTPGDMLLAHGGVAIAHLNR
ncbi:HypC/HybG/HupF family hydrogenase formation chaperone [Dictyobacter kobayashii]|uniref:Hydrogenase assembly protein HupF n=1 Tax=Dictyobacter kobayashii TaxID=2014872 RepID=A0A402APW9_9CHLR|nr:HypC/HybG/HupF family hydrogenase formation chaperone [Dictyobacter kobayashii]GCE21167.1 hypothetical protein KDK_49670 [Dictyobacter kobayashii]